MAESALERTARALDLIPFISKNPGWSVSELAEKFQTTPSQIMKDLEMLFMCGLPGYTHSELIDLEIYEEYVAVRNPQNLERPRNFSYSEVVALSLGLDSLRSQIADQGLIERAERLRTRLAQFLGQESSIATVLSTESTFTDIDLMIADAIKRGTGIEIEYRSARTDSLSTRTIFPESAYRERGHLYTIAFCQKVRELRHFRNDRIVSATPIHESAKILKESAATTQDGNWEVIARLAPQNRFFVEENPSIITSVKEENVHLLVTFRIADQQWLVRNLISLPGAVEILSPSAFHDLLNSKIDAILELYR